MHISDLCWPHCFLDSEENMQILLRSSTKYNLAFAHASRPHHCLEPLETLNGEIFFPRFFWNILLFYGVHGPAGECSKQVIECVESAEKYAWDLCGWRDGSSVGTSSFSLIIWTSILWCFSSLVTPAEEHEFPCCDLHRHISTPGAHKLHSGTHKSIHLFCSLVCLFSMQGFTV